MSDKPWLSSCNADGSNVRENCTWIEVGCNGRVENPLDAKPGWKMKRAGHQGITTDAFVLNHLQTIIRNLASHEHPAAGQVPEMAPPPPPPPLSGPASYPIHVDVAKADATTVYDSVARVFSGGVQPLRYELLQQPESFGYFSFDPESGIFIFRPTSTYGVASFRFAVIDAKGQRLDSQVNISFDRSTIFPGHPPLTQTPTRPLPAAINPTMTLTSEASNESRRLDYASTEPAEMLTVTDGALRLEAEAFLENLEDGYAGVLNCTVDWVGKDGIPVALKDNDEFPKNYFVTQSIPAVSLPPHEVTNFRMTCMAPDMPITIRDFPVVYAPSAPALRRPLEKDSYTYVDRSGAELKLTIDPDAGSSGARVYNYALESTECGKRSGTLRTEANQNRLNVDGAFNGFFAEGDEKKMVWSNVPVCGKASPILWKLRASGEKRDQGGICRYKHKKDTAGGKSGQMTGLDAFGNSRPCDRSGEWKKQCKDGTPDTEEVACDGPGGGAVAAPGLLCLYWQTVQETTTSSRVGILLTVRMISAATRNSRPSRVARPRCCQNPTGASRNTIEFHDHIGAHAVVALDVQLYLPIELEGGRPDIAKLDCTGPRSVDAEGGNADVCSAGRWLLLSRGAPPFPGGTYEHP